MKWAKARKQIGKKKKKSTAFSSWPICIYVWAKRLLPSEKQQQGQLSSQAASHNHLPTLQPPPNPASALPRGQRPSHASNNGEPKKAGRCPLARTALNKDGFCRNQLLFLMVLFQQLSLVVHPGSNQKSTKCRGRKKGIAATEERGTERSVEHVLCEHSGSEAGQGRCWNSSGGSPGLPALPDTGRSRLPWWHPAAGNVSSALSFCRSSCLVGGSSSKKEEKMFVS